MNRNWQDYQKEIADDRYYYVRSCIRQNFFPGSEKAFLNIMHDDLGRDCFDDPLHTSCTGIGYHADIVPLETIMTVVARQFALMGEAGYENFISSCITSFGIYTEILATWEEFPETEERAREALYKATGRTLVKPKNLAHTSDVVFHHREAIAARARHRLVNVLTGEPLRVVEHIGCHYAKIFPKSGVGGSEFPYVLSGMVESWGGQCVDYPERRHCCGFGFRNYLVQANRGYSVANTQKKLESMPPTSPISSWPTVPAARCSSTSGSIRSPRWRAVPTARTGTAFRCSPTRRWPDWCSATIRGRWGCRCTRSTSNRCWTRWVSNTIRQPNIWE